MSSLLETTLASFASMMSMNAVSCFLCSREAARAMRTGGIGGRIINVSSRAAAEHSPGMIAYVASKSAVSAMTVALAAELKQDRILVNAVLPSIIDTPANRAAMPQADFSSWPKPTEIAEVITGLASPTQNLISGALVPVYGRA
jgi:NAD(P)-dependent dehydrogenase (short-subunit alcohol dehydrogenase family)